MRRLKSPSIRKSDCEAALWIETQRFVASVVTRYDAKRPSEFFVVFNYRTWYVVATGVVTWVEIFPPVCPVLSTSVVTWLVYLFNVAFIVHSHHSRQMRMYQRWGTQECVDFRLFGIVFIFSKLWRYTDHIFCCLTLELCELVIFFTVFKILVYKSSFLKKVVENPHVPISVVRIA